MLSFLPAPVLAASAFLLVALNTVFWSCLVLVVAFVKLLIPTVGWRAAWGRLGVWLAGNWVSGNNGITWLTQRIVWDVQLPATLSRSNWYLVSSNHRSWADIVVLQRVLHRRVPFLRFFLKQELIWVPLLGLAWWGLDFPFMKRYSKATLAKHPHLRGKDLETTRKVCEHYQRVPTSIVNFLEGTRFTEEKGAQQGSPYRHLLHPKAGGIAFALGVMGDRFTSILDVTVVYPKGPCGLWSMLAGRIRKVVVRVQELEIPEAFRGGDYLGDSEFREAIQAWCRELWSEKDGEIDELRAGAFRNAPVATETAQGQPTAAASAVLVAHKEG